jgi:hypothetical protein
MTFEVELADIIANATEISRMVAVAFKSTEPFKSIFQDTDLDEYQKRSFD